LIDAREDEESGLLVKLRNLGIMPSDDERMGVTTIKDEELHDDHQRTRYEKVMQNEKKQRDASGNKRVERWSGSEQPDEQNHDTMKSMQRHCTWRKNKVHI
jgi:hypothetical protein